MSGPYAEVMKTPFRKHALNTMALCVCFLSALPIVQAAEPITISMTADRWQTKENAEFLRQLGFYHGLMRLNSGNAVLKGITFSDGTIEFDVNTIGRGAPGIAFRQQDEDNFELVYLRPDPACPAFRACIQYAPQTHGVLLWDLFPQYQTRAPLRENGWNHIKIVVSGRRMNVFVNDAASPTLEVGRLEGDAMKGGLQLQGPGTFANMVITPDAVDGLSPEPARDPLDGDRGLVRNWHLSAFSPLPNGKDPMYDEMPGASQEWKKISTERNGLVNLSRQYGRPVPEPNRALAWLKTTITSDKKQTKKVDIGWTRELWVFVNGKLVYADRNLFEVEGARKFPDARCSLENGSFPLPLEAGDNEIAVAIANNFFGWGMMLRLTDSEGVRLAAK
jgi:3-keto-disaccharide hydrolase